MWIKYISYKKKWGKNMRLIKKSSISNYFVEGSNCDISAEVYDGLSGDQLGVNFSTKTRFIGGSPTSINREVNVATLIFTVDELDKEDGVDLISFGGFVFVDEYLGSNFMDLMLEKGIERLKGMMKKGTTYYLRERSSGALSSKNFEENEFIETLEDATLRNHDKISEAVEKYRKEMGMSDDEDIDGEKYEEIVDSILEEELEFVSGNSKNNLLVQQVDLNSIEKEIIDKLVSDLGLEKYSEPLVPINILGTDVEGMDIVYEKDGIKAEILQKAALYGFKKEEIQFLSGLSNISSFNAYVRGIRNGIDESKIKEIDDMMEIKDNTDVGIDYIIASYNRLTASEAMKIAEKVTRVREEGAIFKVYNILSLALDMREVLDKLEEVLSGENVMKNLNDLLKEVKRYESVKSLIDDAVKSDRESIKNKIEEAKKELLVLKDREYELSGIVEDRLEKKNFDGLKEISIELYDIRDNKIPECNERIRKLSDEMVRFSFMKKRLLRRG